MTDALSFYEPLVAPSVADAGRVPGVSDRPAPTQQARQKAATRQRIVETASQLFSANGYDGTSLQDIAEGAGVSPSTLRRHFPGKVDLALEQVRQWTADFVETMEARPERETPDQMLAAALEWLDDDVCRGVPSAVMAIISTGASLEIAGRVHQVELEKERALGTLFARRLGYPSGSLAPRFLAAAFVAAWRVAVYGSAELTALGLDPPRPDQIGLQCFGVYAQGLRQLWADE